MRNEKKVQSEGQRQSRLSITITSFMRVNLRRTAGVRTQHQNTFTLNFGMRGWIPKTGDPTCIPLQDLLVERAGPPVRFVRTLHTSNKRTVKIWKLNAIAEWCNKIKLNTVTQCSAIWILNVLKMDKKSCIRNNAKLLIRSTIYYC